MYLQKIPAGPRQWPQQALSAGLSPCPADRGPSYASWVLAEPWLLPVGGPFPRAGGPSRTEDPGWRRRPGDIMWVKTRVGTAEVG